MVVTQKKKRKKSKPKKKKTAVYNHSKPKPQDKFKKPKNTDKRNPPKCSRCKKLLVLERDWNDKWNCWYSEGQCINKSGIPCKKRTTNRQNTQGSGIANVGTNPDSNRTVKERHEQALVDRKDLEDARDADILAGTWNAIQQEEFLVSLDEIIGQSYVMITQKGKDDGYLCFNCGLPLTEHEVTIVVNEKGHSFHTDKCWSDYEYSLEAASAAASAHLELSKERIEEIHFELSHLESIGELTEENRDEYLVEVDSIVANCPSLLVSEARLYYFNVYILYYISYYSKYEQRSCFTG